MRKLFTAAVLLAACCTFAGAVPASRKPYTAVQPDGSTVTLVNHGDEFHNWTTLNGVPVRRDAAGFWRPCSLSAPGPRAAGMRARARSLQTRSLESSISMGSKHFLVILIEFSDLRFKVDDPAGAFTRLLNEPGYSSYGATGSVKDFYSDNSSGKFQPTFDVYGPVRLSQSYSYYGKQEGNETDLYPDLALYEACQLLDSRIDFSEYDHDHDGYVDNVFFYYAGHNQAEGGGADTIWPHAWALYRYNGTFDGVRVWSYACASEFRGSSGTTMCSIGTFTHEFGHVLGLPDFYDTDYEANGYTEGLGEFSTMCMGCYNNAGRTPPNFNAVERSMLGWMELPAPAILSSGVTLRSISGNEAFIIPTSSRGEFFLLEMRDATLWDAFLPAGMVVYHVDRSSNLVGGYYHAYELWDAGYSINDFGDHPCFCVVPSQAIYPSQLAVFPGSGGVTSLELRDWLGRLAGTSIRDISLSGDSVSFFAEVKRSLSGTVHSPDGLPLDGVSVVLSPSADAAQPAMAPRYGTTTGFDGRYSITLPGDEKQTLFLLRISKRGYVSQGLKIDVQGSVEYIAVLEPSEEGAGDGALDLAAMGFMSIECPAPADGWKSGDTFPLSLCLVPGTGPDAVEWYYDGAGVSAPSVVLSRGAHVVQAVVRIGSVSEELTLELNVR